MQHTIQLDQEDHDARIATKKDSCQGKISEIEKIITKAS